MRTSLELFAFLSRKAPRLTKCVSCALASASRGLGLAAANGSLTLDRTVQTIYKQSAQPCNVRPFSSCLRPPRCVSTGPVVVRAASLLAASVSSGGGAPRDGATENVNVNRDRGGAPRRGTAPHQRGVLAPDGCPPRYSRYGRRTNFSFTHLLVPATAVLGRFSPSSRSRESTQNGCR